MLAVGVLVSLMAESTQIASADPQFKAPQSWTVLGVPRTKSNQFLKVWRSREKPSKGFTANINLAREASGTPVDAFATGALATLSSEVGSGFRIVRRSPNARCPKGSSVIVESTVTGMSGNDVILEQVFTRFGALVYTATYSREISAHADPKAAAAVEGFCPKR